MKTNSKKENRSFSFYDRLQCLQTKLNVVDTSIVALVSETILQFERGFEPRHLFVLAGAAKYLDHRELCGAEWKLGRPNFTFSLVNGSAVHEFLDVRR